MGVFLWLWYFYLSTFLLILLCHPYSKPLIIRFFLCVRRKRFLFQMFLSCNACDYFSTCVCWLLAWLLIIALCIVKCGILDKDDDLKGNYLIDLVDYAVWSTLFFLEINDLTYRSPTRMLFFDGCYCWVMCFCRCWFDLIIYKNQTKNNDGLWLLQILDVFGYTCIQTQKLISPIVFIKWLLFELQIIPFDSFVKIKSFLKDNWFLKCVLAAFAFSWYCVVDLVWCKWGTTWRLILQGVL